MKKKALALSVLTALSSQAGAFQFDTGDDWSIRWDNSFKANVMMRVAQQDEDVYAVQPPPRNPLTAQLADDSNLSVDRGDLVSTRVDVLSELDVIWKDKYGFRISGSAWYDYMYDDSSNRTGDRTLQNGFSPANATWGALSEQPNNYTSAAEDLHYAGGELLDAFAFANWDIGEVAGNLRLGRHTLYWGQSFLTSGAIHGIAGSMAAIDLAKGFSVPGSEAKELFMPNAKASTVIQFTDNLTFNAFYAFEHLVHRFPERGTYFSPAELLTEDSELLVLAPGPVRSGFRVRDDKIKDSGEWGVNFQYWVDAWNLETSFVYINATDRSVSGLYGSFGGVPTEEFNKFLAKSSAAVLGYYGWVYKDDIDVYGISLSKEIAGISFGMDLVYRDDMPINPELSPSLLGRDPASTGDWSSDGKYPGATGESFHVVVNGFGLLNGDWGLWDGGSYIVEVVGSVLTDFKDNEQFASVRVHEDRWVTSIGVVFRPTWYQVFPGWDLTVPTSVSYTIDGEQAPITSGGNEEIGNGSLGIEFRVNEVWTMSAKYNVFFGPAANGTAGLLKDRDNVALTVKRTF